MSSHEIIHKIKQKALSLNFLECGIISLRFLKEEQSHLERWISGGMNGEMHYMARNIDKRLDPRLLSENAKTMIVVLQNYFTHEKQSQPDAPMISKYAYGNDYHFVMKQKLAQLLEFIQIEIAPCSGRAFVDSAPILERAWAQLAGLGWIGRNSNLISPQHGSFFFIGELIIDIDLQTNKPQTIPDRCGKCTRCINTCPTQAILPNRTIDARKCISYQTIELKGDMDETLKGRFKNHIFGCDICQDVCPWNSKALPHSELQFTPSPRLLQMTQQDWRNISEQQFDELFKKSAIMRTGFERLKRNLAFIENQPDETNEANR